MTVRKQRRRHSVSWDSRLSLLIVIIVVAIVAAALVTGSKWMWP